MTSTHDASGGAAASLGFIQSLAEWASRGIPQALLVTVALGLANGGISEEAGWRGYLLPELLRGRRAVFAGLLAGLMWGLWHTGPAFWAGVFQADRSVFDTPIQYTIAIIPLSVI